MKNNFIIGPGAATTISDLATELKCRIREEQEENFGRKFSKYVPWMSFVESSPGLRLLLDKELPRIIMDSEYLLILAKAFFESQEKPLGKLQLDDEHVNLAIYTPGSKANIIENYESAVELLRGSSSFFDEIYPFLIDTVVPLEVVGAIFSSRAAFSSHDIRGAVFRVVPRLDLPFWKIDLAIDIAHEIGHQALMIYQAADAILDSEFDQLIISGVRKVHRPAIMSLHAAAALAYMVSYLRDQTSETALLLLEEDELQYAKSELNRYEKDLETALNALKACRFTELGRVIYREFFELVT